MGSLVAKKAVELRQYDNPNAGASSQYDRYFPVTSFDAVYDKNTGETLTQVLANADGPDVYRCTGVADSTAVATLVNSFFSIGTAMTKKIKIVGTMGVEITATYYAMQINAVNSRGATCYLDFSECTIPEITEASRDFLYVSSATAKLNVTGLTVTATRYGVYLLNSKNNVFSDCTISSSTSNAFYIISSSNNSFSNCAISCYDRGVYMSNSGNNYFDNCMITNGSYGVYLGGSSNNAFSNCMISGGTFGVYISGSNNNTFTNCMISGSTSGVNLTSSGSNNVFSSCTISSSSNYGVNAISAFSGSVTFQSCKIIGASRGIYMISANTAAIIIVVGCQVKGATQDIQQTTAANTAKWHIRGNSFSKASIIVDGTTAITSKAASASIYFPANANLFSRTID